MSAARRQVADCFAREVERDKVADSYLFVGPSRPRLRRIARACAALLLETGPDPEVHPDCVVYDPEELGVAALRVEHITPRKEGVTSLEESLRYRPVAGGRRAALLYEADRMGPDAQATLLKTVEEPPPGTVLLLTAADLGPLLPALRSRCRIYRVGPPAPQDLQQRAREAGLEEEEWERLRAGLGSAEAVLDLDAGERARLHELHAAFHDWLAGRAGASAWAQVKEGSLAEQRAVGARELAACLGWLARAYREAPAGQCLALDRAAGLIAAALGDLARQITPAVIFEDLVIRLDESPAAA